MVKMTNLVNRLHKTLEGAPAASNLTSVLTDVQGVSARLMLSALLKRQTDPEIADKGHCAGEEADCERAWEVKATQQFIVGELLAE